MILLLLFGGCLGRDVCSDVVANDREGVLGILAVPVEGSPTYPNDAVYGVSTIHGGVVAEPVAGPDGWACAAVPAGETLFVDVVTSPTYSICWDAEYTRVPEGGYVELTVEVYCPDADTGSE